MSTLCRIGLHSWVAIFPAGMRCKRCGVHNNPAIRDYEAWVSGVLSDKPGENE